MNKNQKGFITPLVVIIIAFFVIGGGISYYLKNKNEDSVVKTETVTSSAKKEVTNKDADQSNVNINQNNTTKESVANLQAQLQQASLDVVLYTNKEPVSTRVTLTNGTYKYKSIFCTSVCTFDLDSPQFVDIDEDGQEDALAIGIVWNGGQERIFSGEVFLNKNGKLSYIGRISPMGRTKEIKKSGKNKIAITYDSTENPGHEWTNPVTETYAIENGKLVKI